MTATTAPARPKIALVGLPQAGALFDQAGYPPLESADTSARTVHAAVKEMPPGTYLIITHAQTIEADPRVGKWLTREATNGRQVLVLGESDLGSPIHTLPLPASIDQIMAVFGAPPRKDGSGQVVIDVDGAPLQPEPSMEFDWSEDEPTPAVPDEDLWAEANPEPEDDIEADLFGDDEDPEIADEVAYVHPEPVPVPAPDPTPVAPRRPAPARKAIPTPPVEAAPLSPASTGGHTPQRPATTEGYDLHEVTMTRFRRDEATVIFVVGGRGGVGKSTMSQAIAEHAASQLNRVVLVDMSLGQGDQRTYLRLDPTKRALPSILDARRAGKIAGAILRDEILRTHRTPGLPETHFGVVLAPPNDLADPTIVTPGTYAAAIRAAAKMTDLVVVDCPVAKGVDRDRVIDEVVLPMIRAGAWGLMLGDASAPGGKNGAERLAAWSRAGVPVNRFGFVINKGVPGFAQGAAVQNMLNGCGGASFLGSIVEDEAISAAFNSGKIPTDHPEVLPVLDSILHFTTQLPGFDPEMKTYLASSAYAPQDVEIEAPRKGGLLSRLLGKK